MSGVLDRYANVSNTPLYSLKYIKLFYKPYCYIGHRVGKHWRIVSVQISWPKWCLRTCEITVINRTWECSHQTRSRWWRQRSHRRISRRRARHRTPAALAGTARAMFSVAGDGKGSRGIYIFLLLSWILVLPT